MRMLDFHKDIWSLDFSFILYIIHIQFNLEIKPKQGNVENINQFKKESCKEMSGRRIPGIVRLGVGVTGMLGVWTSLAIIVIDHYRNTLEWY